MSTSGSATALTLAADVPLCPDCCERSGLCVRCAKSVVPQLAQPHWYRLVGKDRRGADQIADGELSREGRKAKNRRTRKAARRLARALAGEFTRSAKAA